MSRRLTFEFKAEKFVNAALYLVERCPDVTKLKLFKLLYFADKYHLLNYARPVIGDRYVKMEHGPVPSRAYNLVKHDERSRPEEQALFDDYLAVQGNGIVAKSPANLAHLSETDIEALDDVVARFGKLTPSQLSKLSHRDAAWINPEMNSDMDYRLLFAEQGEAVLQIAQLAQEDQELRDLIAEDEFEDEISLLRT